MDPWNPSRPPVLNHPLVACCAGTVGETRQRHETRPTRLNHVAGFNIDTVAVAAGDDPDILRLENLDTDLLPPAAAIEATRAA